MTDRGAKLLAVEAPGVRGPNRASPGGDPRLNPQLQGLEKLICNTGGKESKAGSPGRNLLVLEFPSSTRNM